MSSSSSQISAHPKTRRSRVFVEAVTQSSITNRVRGGYLVTLSTYIQEPFEHAHEERGMLQLARLLRRELGHTRRHYSLVANVTFNGQQIDGLLISDNLIAIIELKEVLGPLRGTEKGTWIYTDSRQPVLAGTHKNPFVQVKWMRGKLMKYLTQQSGRFMTKKQLFQRSKKFGQIACVLVFAPQLKQGSSIKIHPQHKTWFYHHDIGNAAEFIGRLNSKVTYLERDECEKLIHQVWQCEPWEVITPPQYAGTIEIVGADGTIINDRVVVGEMTIGRSPNHPITLPGDWSNASRNHARVWVVQDTVYIADGTQLGGRSSHGTFINNGKTVENDVGTKLNNGDRVYCGIYPLKNEIDSLPYLRFVERGALDSADATVTSVLT